MAKKSAKSKGFRRTTGKKPYLSKRDIGILCVVLAVLAVGAVLLFSYDDGALKTKDGAIVDAGENWLIVNGSATSGGRRYYKLAEVDDIDGYTRQSDASIGDDNLHLFNYHPEDGANPVQDITISASHAGAKRLAEYYSSLISGIGDLEVGDGSVDGVDFSYFTYTNAYYAGDDADEAEAGAEADVAEGETADATEAEADAAEREMADAVETDAAEAETGEAEADEPEPNHYNQFFHAYIDAAHDSSAAVAIQIDVPSADDYLSADALKEVLAQAVAAIRFEAE